MKIGLSNNPKIRLKNLQTGHIEPLKIHYMQEVSAENVLAFERIIHKSLAHKRVRGEWFNIDAEEAIFEVKMAFMTYDDEPGFARRFKSGSVLLR